MENFLAKFKEGNNKKQIENIVIFIALLIIVIIVINSLFNEEKTIETNVEPQNTNSNNIVSNDELEMKLQNILSNINGVGSVDVMISYSNTVTQVPMYSTKENTTTVEEQDVNGGKRKTEEISNEQSIIFEEKSNTKTPAVKQTIMPEVIGVIVVAEGADNSVIKENIKNAVEAVLNIPSHRIQVFSK